MGEDKRSQGDQRPKRDDGEPTPIFDAVFSATRAQATANARNPSDEPGGKGP
ncbi:hypothetical protein [Amycolatopsis sp. NPDC051128]|uniref:hypothetical protein n=1 Tax=Amycolatopsis sp. NPDC051128 TaxID=3155412 RepID=UPI00341BF5DA